MTQIINSLAEIAADYDVLFCDLWGCLHNGVAPYPAAVALLSHPLVAILMLLFILSACIHMRLGMQVVIEDYIQSEGTKVLAVMANTFFAIAVGAASVYAVLKLSFGG